MTEKRFKVNADYLNNLDSIIDNETGIEHDYLEIEELLNDLNNENKELKLQLEAFKDKLCELGVSDVKLYGKRYNTGLKE